MNAKRREADAENVGGEPGEPTIEKIAEVVIIANSPPVDPVMTGRIQNNPGVPVVWWPVLGCYTPGK
jgi:hypothetical protein